MQLLKKKSITKTQLSQFHSLFPHFENTSTVWTHLDIYQKIVFVPITVFQHDTVHTLRLKIQLFVSPEENLDCSSAHLYLAAPLQVSSDTLETYTKHVSNVWFKQYMSPSKTYSLKSVSLDLQKHGLGQATKKGSKLTLTRFKRLQDNAMQDPVIYDLVKHTKTNFTFHKYRRFYFPSSPLPFFSGAQYFGHTTKLTETNKKRAVKYSKKTLYSLGSFVDNEIFAFHITDVHAWCQEFCPTHTEQVIEKYFSCFSSTEMQLLLEPMKALPIHRVEQLNAQEVFMKTYTQSRIPLPLSPQEPSKFRNH